MTLYIDRREYKSLRSQMLSLAVNRSIKASITTLQVGDYAFGNEKGYCGIERKTVKDLLSSIYDGRLWNQIWAMKDNYKYPILLIEGDIYHPLIEEKKRKVLKTTVSRIIFHNVNVIIVPDWHTSRKLILDLYSAFKDPSSSKPPVKLAGRSTDKPQIRMLAAIPGVGRKKANVLLKKFKSIRSIANASERKLSEVKGINDKLASNIYLFFNENRGKRG